MVNLHVAEDRVSQSATGDADWGPGPAPVSPGAPIADGYTVVAHLRRGRRLDVYDVWSDARGCRCVVKTLRPERAGDGDAVARLHTEGHLLLTATHPNLVRAYQIVDTTDDPDFVRPAVVLETLTGETLDLVLDGDTLTSADVAVLGLQLCSALRYLHSLGWLHLDVKPGNIVVSGGRAVLLDLSLMRRIGDEDGGGTFDYLSPEQARCGRVTEASDVWGLGGTLFTALTGQPPYADWSSQRDAAGERHYPQLLVAPPRLTGRRNVDRRLGALVDACLERDPTIRIGLDEATTTLMAIAGFDPQTVTEA